MLCWVFSVIFLWLFLIVWLAYLADFFFMIIRYIFYFFVVSLLFFVFLKRTMLIVTSIAILDISIPLDTMKILSLSVLDLFLRQQHYSILCTWLLWVAGNKEENNSGYWWCLDGMCYIYIHRLKFWPERNYYFSTRGRRLDASIFTIFCYINNHLVVL